MGTAGSHLNLIDNNHVPDDPIVIGIRNIITIVFNCDAFGIVKQAGPQTRQSISQNTNQPSAIRGFWINHHDPVSVLVGNNNATIPIDIQIARTNKSIFFVMNSF